MAIVSQAIPAMYNGVSQQAPSLRLQTQCAEQINMFPTLAQGNMKRPPTEHVARVAPYPGSNIKVHHIHRDSAEHYQVTFKNGAIQIHDLVTGAYVPVAIEDVDGYLSTTDPNQDITCVTVADHTFIVNRRVKVKMLTSEALETPPTTGYVYVKKGYRRTSYSVSAGGKSASYTTDDENYSTWRTTSIRSNLQRGLADAGLSVSAVSNTIRINGVGSDISTSDSYGDQALVCWNTTIQKFSDLPNKCFGGTRVKVHPDAEENCPAYYVEYDGTEDIWKESRGWNQHNKLDPATMPHKLVRQADGTFTVEQITWAEREVGDDDTCSIPSFVGNKINGIFFFRNRLGLMSGENVILSRSSDFWNFWPETVTDNLDTDPIDVAVSCNTVAILKHALPFHGSLLLLSDNAQFQLSADGPLTPSSVSLNQTTAFECPGYAPPASAGQNAFFTIDKGAFTGLMEYFVDDDSVSNDAADITAHCPRYVPGNVIQVAASSNEDLILLVSAQDPSSIYAYKYYWSGNKKLQSAWGRWTMGGTVRGISINNTDIIVSIDRDGDLYIEKLALQFDGDPGFGWIISLDQKATVQGTYNADTMRTAWALPYAAEGATLVYGLEWEGRAGHKVSQQVTYDGNMVYVDGDLSAYPMIIGKPYMSKYVFSEQFVRTGAEDSESIIEGRLQLHQMSVNYTDSGYFRATVQLPGRPLYTYELDSQLGSATAIIGKPDIKSGTFTFPVRSVSSGALITLENDTHYPSTFQSAAWRGNFTMKSKRL